jgi:hypothetical protein
MAWNGADRVELGTLAIVPRNPRKRARGPGLERDLRLRHLDHRPHDVRLELALAVVPEGSVAPTRV